MLVHAYQCTISWNFEVQKCAWNKIILHMVHALLRDPLADPGIEHEPRRFFDAFWREIKTAKIQDSRFRSKTVRLLRYKEGDWTRACWADLLLFSAFVHCERTESANERKLRTDGNAENVAVASNRKPRAPTLSHIEAFIFASTSISHICFFLVSPNFISKQFALPEQLVVLLPLCSQLLTHLCRVRSLGTAQREVWRAARSQKEK